MRCYSNSSKSMNPNTSPLLTQMVAQFRQRHQKLPRQLVVTPLAALALAIKGGLAPVWEGIPVVCRDIAEIEVADPASPAACLAVLLVPEEDVGRLVTCDLKV